MALYKTFKGYSSISANKPYTSITDIDLIKRDLTNHFAIKRGEKLENPEFGTIIPFLLFEPMSTDVLAAIEDDVERIVNFDPRCQLEVVRAQPITANSAADFDGMTDYQGVKVQCQILYIPFAASDVVNWEFTTEGFVRLTS